MLDATTDNNGWKVISPERKAQLIAEANERNQVSLPAGYAWVPDHRGWYAINREGKLLTWFKTDLDYVHNGRFMTNKSWKLNKPEPVNTTLGVGGHITASILSRTEPPYPTPLYKLVLETFVGEAPEGSEAAFRNGDLTDCSLNNLFWGRPLGVEVLISSSLQEGTAPVIKPKRAPRYVRKDIEAVRALSKEQVREIRTSQLSCRALAKQYGICPVNVSRCRTGVTYTEYNAELPPQVNVGNRRKPRWESVPAGQELI